MHSRDFCYWLQGFFEIHSAHNGSNQSSPPLTPHQVEAIRNHLNLVFKHEIDPAMGDVAHQKKLNETHSPKIGGTDPVTEAVYR